MALLPRTSQSPRLVRRGPPAQEVWLALVEAELKKVKDRMQGKVRTGRKKKIEGYIKKRRAHFDAGRVGIMVDNVFGRRMGLGVVGRCSNLMERRVWDQKRSL